jgi:hypothetical protein
MIGQYIRLGTGGTMNLYRSQKWRNESRLKRTRSADQNFLLDPHFVLP